MIRSRFHCGAILFDIVTAAATAVAGDDAVTVELAAGDAALLAELAQRAGIDADAMWRAGWALVAGAADRRSAGADRPVGPATARSRRSHSTFLPRAMSRRGSPGRRAAPARSTNGVARAGESAADPLPHTAWGDGDRALGDGGPALVWHSRGAAATARFAAQRIDRATVERLGELLRCAMAALVAPGARLETASPLRRPSAGASSRTGTRPRPSTAPRPRCTACSASRPPRRRSASR